MLTKVRCFTNYESIIAASFTSSAIFSSINWAVALLIALTVFFLPTDFYHIPLLPKALTITNTLFFHLRGFRTFLTFHKFFLYFLFLEKAPARLWPEKISCLNLGGLKLPSPPDPYVYVPTPAISATDS